MLKLEEAGERRGGRVTVIPQRGGRERNQPSPAEQSAAETVRESMLERTTRAAVHISMDRRVCTEHCVTDCTASLASLSGQLWINQLEGKNGCGIVNTSNRLWKTHTFVRVCVCVQQLVICAALSTSAGIDPASSSF